MSKPNPEKFAEHVLWSLAGIQAQLAEIEAHLAISSAHGDTAMIERINEASSARRLERQNDLFEHMKKSAGIDGSAPPSTRDPRA
jgi:hypothetical protein